MIILPKSKNGSDYLEVSEYGKNCDFDESMLVDNDFSFLPKVYMKEMDQETCLLYDVGGLSYMKSRLMRRGMDGEDLKAFFLNLAACFEELQKHLLEPSNIVLDSAYILYDRREKHYSFIYVPGAELDFRAGLKSLMDEIMVSFDHDDTAGVELLYDSYSEFIQEGFTPQGFLSLVEKSCNKSASSPQSVSCVGGENRVDGMNYVETSNYMGDVSRVDDVVSNRQRRAGSTLQDNSSFYQNDQGTERQNSSVLKTRNYQDFGMERSKVENSKKESDIKRIIIGGCFAFGITVLLLLMKGIASIKYSGLLIMLYFVYVFCELIRGKSEEEEADEAMMEYQSEQRQPATDMVETSVLYDETVCQIVPRGFESGKAFYIVEGLTEIGRKSTCPYRLEAPGVSRVHAVIEKKNQYVSITDQGSTNGTFLNEKKLEALQPVEIHRGDVLRLGVREFVCM